MRLRLTLGTTLLLALAVALPAYGGAKKATRITVVRGYALNAKAPAHHAARPKVKVSRHHRSAPSAPRSVVVLPQAPQQAPAATQAPAQSPAPDFSALQTLTTAPAQVVTPEAPAPADTESKIAPEVAAVAAQNENAGRPSLRVLVYGPDALGALQRVGAQNVDYV